jgi:hypothetical protein
MRLGRFLLVLLLGCFVGAAPVFAQLDLDDFDEIYIAPDDSYEFLFPSDWEVDDSDFEDSGFILLTGEVGRDSVYINFVGPELMDSLDSGIGDLEEAGEALAEAFEIEEFNSVEITEREMLLGPIVFEDAVGVALVVEFEDGGFGAIIAFDDTENIFDNEDIVTTVLLVTYTFNSVGANGVDGGDDDEDEDEDEDEDRGGGSSSLPDELRDFDGTWQDAIAELEDEEVIASGGSLIFNENSAFFDGIGSWFTPLASRSQRRDIVMAATLEFTSDSRDFESCSIMARIEDSNTNIVDTYLEVGITNDGEAFWLDSEGNDSNSDVVDLNLDLDEPHHILFIAQLDSLNVYVDGELVFDDVRINERVGYFGIALLGQGAGSRCEGTNVWAYDAPAFIEGLCEVAASGTVNLRSGPGTDFERAGTLNGGDRVEVVGQAEDDSGFIWYELDNDAWVREDVISLQGDCGDIPESD